MRFSNCKSDLYERVSDNLGKQVACSFRGGCRGLITYFANQLFAICPIRKTGTVFVFLISLLFALPARAQFEIDTPPDQIVKLIFIHHSCGRNLLQDQNGGLGEALAKNNYFVSDTNYGWGPNSIGDRTDITDWPEWFVGPESERYLAALYNESGQNSRYTRDPTDPGGENQIIMFKSCYPNSRLKGNPDDPPLRGVGQTVANAKAIYNELLTYFVTRPDKLFIVLTAPPLLENRKAANARAFDTWLVEEWLQGYEGSNVAVFDFYNVLTDPNNHHRIHDGRIEYITDQGDDVLYYDSDGDDHPSSEGNLKAVEEFTPLLNVYYHLWQAGELPVFVGEKATAEMVVESTNAAPATIEPVVVEPTVTQPTVNQPDIEMEVVPEVEPAPTTLVGDSDSTEQTNLQEEPERTNNGRSGLCLGSMVMGLTAVISLGWGTSKKGNDGNR